MVVEHPAPATGVPPCKTLTTCPLRTEPLADAADHLTRTGAERPVCEAVTVAGAPAAPMAVTLVSVVAPDAPTLFLATSATLYFAPMTTPVIVHAFEPKSTVQVLGVASVGDVAVAL